MSDEPFRGQPDAVEIIARAIVRRSIISSEKIAFVNRDDAIDRCWHLSANEAREFIAALNAAGLVIVPKEPSIDMTIAGCEVSLVSRPDLEGEYVTGIYAAMISQTLAADGSSKNPTEDRE